MCLYPKLRVLLASDAIVHLQLIARAAAADATSRRHSRVILFYNNKIKNSTRAKMNFKIAFNRAKCAIGLYL